jgi:DNA-binding NarL/FixJ family response regulator
MAAIRVLLADDHAVVRKGIRDFLEEEGDIQVIAEASDGEQAKQLILAQHPDVVILDIRMPRNRHRGHALDSRAGDSGGHPHSHRL